MRKNNTPTVALFLVVALLGGALAVDRAGWSMSSRTDDVPTPQARYLQRAALIGAQEQLVANASQWDDAAAGARRLWHEWERRLVRAPSMALAGARVRDVLLDELSSLGVASARVAVIDPAPSNSESIVQSIKLSIGFDAVRHVDVLTAIDRLEHLDGALLSIVALTIDGPGRMQVPEVLSVELEIEALVLIEPEPARSDES